MRGSFYKVVVMRVAGEHEATAAWCGAAWCGEGCLAGAWWWQLLQHQVQRCCCIPSDEAALATSIFKSVVTITQSISNHQSVESQLS